MITSRARLLTRVLIAILAIAIGVLAIGAGSSPAARATSRKLNGRSAAAASRRHGRKCSAGHPARGRVRGHPSRVRRCVKKRTRSTGGTSTGRGIKGVPKRAAIQPNVQEAEPGGADTSPGGGLVSGDPTDAGLVEGDPAGTNAVEKDATGTTRPEEDSSGATQGEAGSSGSTTTESSPEQTGKSGSSLTTPFRFFSPTSFWNTPVSTGAPLDSSSASVIGNFDRVIAAEETAGSGPWIGTTDYSVPIYTVPASQPTVPVGLEHSPEPMLSAAWSSVPLPATAKPASGSDGVLVVSQPSTNRLWEFWRLVKENGSWHASWGGAIQGVSSNGGVFGTEAWPGAEPWWGVSASSLSLAGGVITFEDLEHGQIEHALALAIPGVRAGVYASPARRTDGKSTNSLALPEGAHLRLNPDLDLAALHLPKSTLMIAQAAQRYGIFVRDGAGEVQLFAQDPSALPTNPYTGSNGYFEGMRPAKLMAYFPWKELQLLKMELHTAK
jgi:hypothetical protein